MTTPTPDQLRSAYYAGRNAVWEDEPLPTMADCPFQHADLVAAWKRGVRDIKAEIRLSADVEWD